MTKQVAENELMLSLIASTRTFNPILDIENHSTYSLDMLRFMLEFPSFDALCYLLDSWNGLDHCDTYTTNKIGSYRNMWVWDTAEASQGEKGYKWGKSSVKLVAGFGLNSAKGKTKNVGFIEFNPNKCNDIGLRLIQDLLANGAIVNLIRYDLAIDYPVQRDKVRMIKDKRKYGCEISNGMTEYLGVRNHPGRVKVYDKQAESNLDVPCTRVEITADASWNAQTIIDKLPSLYDYTSGGLSDFGGVIRPFTMALNALLEQGEQIEPWIRLVDPKTRTKIRKFIKRKSDITLKYSYECLDAIIGRALDYQKGEL